MAVENWIDEITKLAGSVSNGKGGKVRSYSVFRKAEFPEVLTIYPCAISYTTEVTCIYSHGASYDLWKGVTEFHISAGVQKTIYPELMRYFALIRNAFALHRTLGGKVAYCQLRVDEASMQGPVTFQYGDEAPHLGILARWEVKELTSVTLGE